jgi:hypothetical protein
MVFNTKFNPDDIKVGSLVVLKENRDDEGTVTSISSGNPKTYTVERPTLKTKWVKIDEILALWEKQV